MKTRVEAAKGMGRSQVVAALPVVFGVFCLNVKNNANCASQLQQQNLVRFPNGYRIYRLTEKRNIFTPELNVLVCLIRFVVPFFCQIQAKIITS